MNNRYVRILTTLLFLAGTSVPAHATEQRLEKLNEYRLKQLEDLCQQQYSSEISIIDHVTVRAGETYESIMNTAGARVPSISRKSPQSKDALLSRTHGPVTRGAKPGIYEIEINVGTAGSKPRLNLKAALVVRPNTHLLLMVSDQPIPFLNLYSEDLGVIANGLHIAIIDQTKIDRWKPTICIGDNTAPSPPQSSYNE